jgi:hypothetical protein
MRLLTGINHASWTVFIVESGGKPAAITADSAAE